MNTNEAFSYIHNTISCVVKLSPHDSVQMKNTYIIAGTP